MSLAKTISKQFVNMVKDSDRVQLSVEQMGDKITKQSLDIVKSAGIDPSQLPFDLNTLLSGNLELPQSLLTPANVCSVPPLTTSSKAKANTAIDDSDIQLQNIIENSNKLKSALIAIRTPIAGIRVMGEGTLSLANSLSNIIKIIKAIPIPTAFGAPAVALPVKVLTILSSTLIKLDKKIDIAKGTVSIIAPMVKRISAILNKSIESVNKLELAIEGSLILRAFVKSVIELGDLCDVSSDLYIVKGNVVNGDTVTFDRVDGLTIGMSIFSVTNGVFSNTNIASINPNTLQVRFYSTNNFTDGTGIVFESYDGSGVSQGDIDEVTSTVNDSLQNALNSSGDNSLLELNQASEADLIASFPFEYKGFLLELVNNPNNSAVFINDDGEEERGPDFPFPSRKIRATRNFTDQTGSKNTIFTRDKFNTPLGQVILHNDPGGQARYSYSSSVAILVEEMKYKIDNYLDGVSELVLPAIADDSGGKAASGTQEYVDNRPDPQFIPGETPGGSDDPPSPTGNQNPPRPPAYFFNGLNPRSDVTPTDPIATGTFTVNRPVKIKMETYGGSSPLEANSTAFLRIYKQTVPGYNYFMEEQIADDGIIVTTQNNPQGYYTNSGGPKPEYWPINPGYANGSVVSNIGIFRYELELTDYSGMDGNSAQFEIEAQ